MRPIPGIYFTRNMKEGETNDEYITVLKRLSQDCNFESLKQSLLKDQLILRLKDMNLKERMLRTVDLNLEKAISICKSAKVAQKQLQDMDKGATGV